MTVKRKDLLDYTEIFLFRFTYIRLLKNGNRNPNDPDPYEMNIVGRNLEDCISYVEKRLDGPIHITENRDKLPINFIADVDFSKDLQQWKNSFDVEQAIYHQKMDYYKAMQKGEVEQPKKKVGSLSKGTW
jgi:hypothetical protein